MMHGATIRSSAHCVVVSLTLSMFGACNRSDHAAATPDGATSPTGETWFVEDASARGVAFTYQSGHREQYYMPEIMGGGAALFDMDNDGDLDIYLVQGGKLFDSAQAQPHNVLLRNDGRGVFVDVTDGSGADDSGFGMGVACGDYDNDGDTDLYVTNYGPNALLQNDGRGRFTDVTETAGVAGDVWSTSAAFADYDRDGDLDLFVCSYFQWSQDTHRDCVNALGDVDYCSPRNFLAPVQDVCYRNNSDGTFTDVTEELGFTSCTGTGLGVVCGDFNNDGWIDVFVANDGMRDQLWLNRNGGRFEDNGVEMNAAYDQDGRAAAGMGVSAGDVDDDGDLDLLVCNLRSEPDTFLINQGGKYFQNMTAASGLSAHCRQFTRFGVGLIDFNNDGVLDLYEANGRVDRQRDEYTGDPYAEPNLLLRGLAAHRFAIVGDTLQKNQLIASSRAAAFGDVDGDGAIDILVVNRDAPASLLINSVQQRGHWIMFRVLNEHGSDALGAQVTLRVGDRTIARDVRAAYSYLSSNDPRIHVGLGEQSDVHAVTVVWPDSTVEVFGDLAADEVHVLRRGHARTASDDQPGL